MQTHTKLYLKFFGYVNSDWIKCEMPDCYKKAVDIHHITARGMGGNPSGDKDVIENLIGLCREHHEEFGDKTEHKEMLKQVHIKNIEDHKRVSKSVMQ